MKQTQSAAKPSDLPVYLFHQGNNFEAYRYFGSHLEEQDGQPEDEETTDENALEEAYAPEAEGEAASSDEDDKK